MFLVNLAETWPEVEAGRATREWATLRAWPGITDDDLTEYGDAVLGVYQNTVKTAYDIDAEKCSRRSDGRMVFAGTVSEKWEYLIGQESPRRWKQGQQWPVQKIASEDLPPDPAAGLHL